MAGRRELLAELVGGLPRSAEHALHPDHPLLLRGPDVLVAHDGSLTAYFVYSGRRSCTAPSERARVLLTRLALPAGSGVVLAVEDPDRVAEDADALHDEVVPLGGRRAGRTPSGRLGRAGAAAAVDELRRFNDQRFSAIWPSVLQPGLRRGRPADTRPTTAELGRRPRRSPAASLAGMSRIAVEEDFYIDRRGNHLRRSLAHLQDGEAVLAEHPVDAVFTPPRTGFDPLKPVRAAAFAGLDVPLADR